LNNTCAFDHETEPIINITVAILDPSTNETLRLMTFPIEIEDENDPPYNLTLSGMYFIDIYLLISFLFS
jgi:hypothetical protein